MAAISNWRPSTSVGVAATVMHSWIHPAMSVLSRIANGPSSARAKHSVEHPATDNHLVHRVPEIVALGHKFEACDLPACIMDAAGTGVMKATRRLDIDAHRVRALETELEALRDRNAALERQIREDEPRRIEERAQMVRLISAAREIHRALYTDNIHRLILETAIGVTSAQRGCVLRWVHGQIEVAATVDVDVSVGQPPSPFMSAIADRVRTRGTPMRWAEREAAFAAEGARGDVSTNGVAVPVLLQGQVAGVILVLDRVIGAFDANDEDNLLVLGGEASVALQNARLRDEIHGAFVTTLALLADLVEARDPYTAGHCERVSRYARATARRLNLSDAQ